MIRQHDVQVLAEGTFRVVLTGKRRVVTVIDVPDSALGPLHLVFAVSPEAMAATSFTTGSIFGDIGHAFSSAAHDVGHAVEKAAEGTFNAASKVATTHRATGLRHHARRRGGRSGSHRACPLRARRRAKATRGRFPHHHEGAPRRRERPAVRARRSARRRKPA